MWLEVWRGGVKKVENRVNSAYGGGGEMRKKRVSLRDGG